MKSSIAVNALAALLLAGKAQAQLKKLEFTDKGGKALLNTKPNEFQAGDELEVRVDQYLKPMESGSGSFGANQASTTLLVRYNQFNWCDVPNAEGNKVAGVQYRLQLPQFNSFESEKDTGMTSLCSTVWLPDSIDAF